MPPFERTLARRARVGGQRLRVAQAVTATLLAEVPLSCVFSFCDFVLPADGLVCASRDSLAVRQPGPSITGDHTEHVEETAGDIAEVAASPSHLVVSRGNGFQVTSSTVCDGGRGTHLKTHAVWDSHASQVITVDITAAGLVATGCIDGSIAVWEPATYIADADGRIGSPLPFTGHSDWVKMLKFASDAVGHVILLSAGDDGKVCVWDAHTTQCLHTVVFPSHAIRAVAASTASDAGVTCLPTVAVAVGATVVVLQWDQGCLAEVLRLAPHGLTPITVMALRGGILACVSEDEDIAVHQIGVLETTVPAATEGIVVGGGGGAADGAMGEALKLSVADVQCLFTAKARLASRLCASLMSTLTRIVVLTAPPTSTAIAVACASSDGDLVVITGFPRSRDVIRVAANTDGVGSYQANAPAASSSWLPSITSPTTSASSTSSAALATKGGARRPASAPPATSGGAVVGISSYFDAFVAHAIALRAAALASSSAAVGDPTATEDDDDDEDDAGAAGRARRAPPVAAESLWRVFESSVLLETGPVVAMATCAADFA